jgi:hypothetical protein
MVMKRLLVRKLLVKRLFESCKPLRNWPGCKGVCGLSIVVIFIVRRRW